MDGIKLMSGNSLYSFNRFVLRLDLLIERVHRPYCNYLSSAVLRKYGRSQPVACSDWDGDDVNPDYPRVTRDSGRQYKLDLMPRDSFKSVNGTLGMSLWLPAEFDHNASVMCVLSTQPLSDMQADEIEGHLMGNPRFRYLYGKWEEGSPTRQKRAKIYKFPDGTPQRRPSKNPSLLMTSTGADLTGLHPLAIILDDPINEKNCDSEVELAAIERFHDALFLLNPAFMWVHGTRWGPTDLYGQRIIGELQEDYDIYIRAAKNPDESLWFPERLSEKALAGKLRVAGRYLFFSQMMNRVVSRTDQPLAIDKILRFEAGEAPKRNDMTVMLWCDPAGQRGTGDSDWAIPMIGFTRDADTDEVHLWLLDHVKLHMTGNAAARAFCQLWWKWRPDCCGCENTGFSQSFIDQTLTPAMIKAGIPNRLVESKPGQRSKASRVFKVESGGIGTLIERGLVHVRREDHAFMGEVAMFPSGSYDLLDAVAQALKEAYMHDWFPAPSRQVKEVADDDYQRVVDDANRILRTARRKELAKAGRGSGPILSDALRGIFQDVRERDPNDPSWGN